MADALALAAGAAPASGRTGGPAVPAAAVIDVATLTYQAVTALGPEIGALIARDEVLGRRVLEAAKQVGEPLWPLPWAPRYRDQTRSRAPGAGLRNHPGTDTGRALTAALFLGAFVPQTVPWAHLDIAGPAMSGSGPDARATGYGVRTLIELIENWPAADLG
jgi:leucyl aminopeptidase